jgi:hypothetical protein
MGACIDWFHQTSHDVISAASELCPVPWLHSAEGTKYYEPK